MEKTLDYKGRWRNTTVAFRMSEEENEDLNTRVRLSGLTKQEYIIRRLLERDIKVAGNPRVYKALRDQMKVIYEELTKFSLGGETGTELLETIQLITITLYGLKGEENEREV